MAELYNKEVASFINEHFGSSERLRRAALERAETLITRGLTDETVICCLIEKELSEKRELPKKLPAEMYDKVNYMCRRYMDRIARFELDFDIIPDTDALKTVIICFFEAAPVMHSRFVDNHISPYWKVCDYHIDDIFTCKETEDLQKSADSFLLNDIDVKSNIQLKIALFTKGIECKLCFMWNHMCMDGGDLKHFLNDLFEGYNRYTNDRIPPIGFRRGSRSYKRIYDDFSAEDKAKAQKLFANVSAHDKHSLPFTDTSIDNRKIIVRKKIDKSIFEAARAVGKKHGATVNDVISAAYIRSFYEISDCPENERIGISCAVDLRRYIKNIENTGYTNHTTFMPCVVDSKGKNMVETLKSVVSSTSKAKQDKFMGLHGLPLLNLGYSTMVYAQAELVVGAFYTNANLAVSNVGPIDKLGISLNGHSPVGASVAGAAKKKPCAMMTALTLNGELSLSVCIQGNDDDAKVLEKLFDIIEMNLKQLAYSD